MANPFKSNKTFYHVLTTRCNWNCSYCDFSYKKIKKDVSKEFLEEYIQYLKELKISKNIEFEIEGGEIGLVSKEILDIWFNSNLVKTYQVITNGKFFENGYYDIYKDKIHYMIYHVISEFYSIDQKFKIYDIPNCDYTIVIHKQNYREFPKLLKKYSYINWLPHIMLERIIGENKTKFLTKEDFYWLYENTKNFNNIDEFMKQRFLILSKISEKNLNIRRKICAKSIRSPLIDLVNQRIYQCCVSASGNYVELNKENLELLIKGKLKFSLDKMCKNCTATMIFLNTGFNERIDIKKIKNVF